MVPYSRRYPILLLLFPCILSFASLASAQMLTIRMINGNSGKPFANKNVFVTFWWDDPSQPPGRRRVRVGFPHDTGGTDIPLDDHGIGHIAIPPQATRVQVQSVENVVIYGKRGQYFLCNVTGNQFMEPDEFWTAGRQLVPLDLISSHGFVPQSGCTPKHAVRPAPGEFVVLAVPEHCWPLCGLSW
jgi:hypothetical protein